MSDSAKSYLENGAEAEALCKSRPLWAPWRIEYIRSEKEAGCFICDLGGLTGGRGSDMVVARGKAVYILMNAYPYNSGHVLIAPYAHLSDLADLAGDVISELMEMTVRIKAVMKRTLAPDGFNFGFNFGAAAGAGLEEHLHGHLVPRWFGDTNFMPVLGDVRVMPEALAATAELLRKGWHELYNDEGKSG